MKTRFPLTTLYRNGNTTKTNQPRKKKKSWIRPNTRRKTNKHSVKTGKGTKANTMYCTYSKRRTKSELDKRKTAKNEKKREGGRRVIKNNHLFISQTNVFGWRWGVGSEQWAVSGGQWGSLWKAASHAARWKEGNFRLLKSLNNFRKS